MRGSTWLAAAIGLVGAFGGATAANAQNQPAPVAVAVPAPGIPTTGPTRMYAVPRANVLGAGTNLVTAGASVGGIGLGPTAVGVGINSITGNALNLRSEMGMGNGFELGTGIAATGNVPWRGRLDVSGKWALVPAGSLASLAGLAGGMLEIDANGSPSLGLQLGLPISGAFLAGNGMPVALALVPSWNLGVSNLPASLVGAGGGFNFFGLGLGADVGVTPRLHVLADTQLGMPVAGLGTQSALGVRYTVGQDWVMDMYVGVNAAGNLGTTGGPAALGLGSSWRF